MRRIVFIICIVLVLAIVGIYTALELRVAEIVFVRDFQTTWAHGKETTIRRLYNSGVDVDAFFAKVDAAIVSAEFTEDEIYAAALASGKPEFYPAFNFNTYNSDIQSDEFDFNASIRQESAPNQTDFNFRISDLHLEILTDGPQLSELEMRAENPNEPVPGSPVISEDKRQLMVDLHNVSGYSLNITGTGRVTFQYTYNIAANSLFSSHALEEQLLVVHANISRNDAGEFEVEYIAEPYSNLEDYGY